MIAWDERIRYFAGYVSFAHLGPAGTVEVAEEDYRMNPEGTTTGGAARFREELKIDHNEVMRLKAGEIFVVGPGEYQRVRVAMHGFDEARWKSLYKELERQAKEEPPPMPRRGHGGPTIVDSTLASGSKNGSTSGAQARGPSSSRKNKPSGQQQNGGLPSPSGKQGQNGGQLGNTPPPVQKQPGQPASPPAPSGKAPVDDEMLPFSFPDVDASAPTLPGVLPLWNENEDEDLLP